MAERMVTEQVARRFIMTGVIAAVISAVLTASFHAESRFRGLVDVVLLLGLALGVHRNSRTCAIILLIYYLGNLLDIYRRPWDAAAGSGLIAIAWMAAYLLAVLGTFAVHAIDAEPKAAATSSGPET